MTERQRAAVTTESRSLLSIRTGIEGFADGMRIFPRLKEWENQIALHALREGKTVDELLHITPFRQYLGADKRAYLADEQSPFSSFRSLFAESPSIDTFVSLGNFHTIRSWTCTLAKQYPDLNLPLEQFFQDALYRIAPYSARDYDPSIGNPFHHFLTGLLKKRFHSFAMTHKREMSSPVKYEEKPTTKKGRPAESSERVKIASLDTQLQHTETPQTLFEYFETTHQIPQDTMQEDDREAREKIHLLSQLAGLNDKQEETLIAMFVYGGTTNLIAQLRHATSRSVRGQRQIAIEKIQQLGYETVSGILTGRNPPQKR